MWLSPPLLKPCTISDSLQRASFHHVLFKPLICYWYEQHQRPFQHLTSQPPQHATHRDRQDPRGLAKQICADSVVDFPSHSLLLPPLKPMRRLTLHPQESGKYTTFFYCMLLLVNSNSKSLLSARLDAS